MDGGSGSTVASSSAARSCSIAVHNVDSSLCHHRGSDLHARVRTIYKSNHFSEIRKPGLDLQSATVHQSGTASEGAGETEGARRATGVFPAGAPAAEAAALSGADTEVVAKPQRRRFTAEYKRRIVREADRCTTPGAIGALLRRQYEEHPSWTVRLH